jgi:two-component system nitrogen regulation response regulator NtrX
MARILIVDDDESVLTSLSGYLRLKGHKSHGAGSAPQGLAVNVRECPDIVVLDVFLKGENGLDLMGRILSRDPPPGVVVVSGHADISTAVRAVKLGAFDFLEKFVDTDRPDVIITNLCREMDLRHGLERMLSLWREENIYIVESPAMRDAVHTAKRAAASRLSILIQGESGTGKEVLARLIHMGSDRVGFFKAATGGTLFLDEVGDIPLQLQPKLLRALKTGRSSVSAPRRWSAWTPASSARRTRLSRKRWRRDASGRIFIIE